MCPTLNIADFLVHNFLPRQPTPSRLAAWHRFTRPIIRTAPFTTVHGSKPVSRLRLCILRTSSFERPRRGVHTEFLKEKGIDMSACSATRSFSEEPMPWPAVAVVRNKIGRPELVAACSRAVILRECTGFTRPSTMARRRRARSDAPCLPQSNFNASFRAAGRARPGGCGGGRF